MAAVFGGAKPVDTAAREREIEEKMRREEQDFAQQVAEKERRVSEGEGGGAREEPPESHRDRQRSRGDSQERDRGRRGGSTDRYGELPVSSSMLANTQGLQWIPMPDHPSKAIHS